MDGITAWILSQAYTKATAEQFGAVKGAPCTVAGTRKDASGNTVFTLSWKNDAGVVKTTDITVTRGADGVGIKSIAIDDDAHLIITYTDDSTEDAGQIKLENKIGVDLRFTVDVGGVKAGSFFPKNTVTNDEMWQKISTKVEAPAVVLTLDPSKTVYDVVSETITGITLKANVTKKTYDVKKLSFYLDDVLIESRDITSGGMNNFAYTPATPIKKTSVFKAVVSDVENNSSNSSVKVSFVGNSYYGVIEPDIGEPTESQIKALNKSLKLVKGYVYENITCAYNKVVYAYPKEFGELSSIRDVKNNVPYTQSFTRTSLKIDGIDYYCYTLTEPTGADGVELTFA